MRHCLASVFLAAVLAAAPAPVQGDDAWGRSPGGGGTDVQDDAALFRVGRFDPQRALPAPKGQALAMGLGAERRYASGLRVGFDLDFLFAQYETPPVSGGPFTVVGDTMDLTSFGVGGSAALGWSIGALDLHAGAGLGLYFSKMTAYASTFGIPVSHDERSVGPGLSLFAGIGLKTGPRTRLGIEARRLWLDAEFGPLSNGGMPIGGTVLALTWRQLFGVSLAR